MQYMFWKWWKAEQGPGNEATVCVSYDLRKQISSTYRCLCVCMCVCVCVTMCVWGMGRSFPSLLALYVNLNGTVVLVRIIWGSTCNVSSVSYIYLPQQYVAILQIAPDRAFIKHAYQADVSMDFHLILEQPPIVKSYARVSFRVSFLYLKINKRI